MLSVPRQANDEMSISLIQGFDVSKHANIEPSFETVT